MPGTTTGSGASASRCEARRAWHPSRALLDSSHAGLPDLERVPADGRPAARDRRHRRGHRGGRPLRDAARRDGHRQDVHDGERHGAPAATVARDRAQQDARSPAVQRVPRVLPRQRRRVLRQLLRLLPARGLPPDVGHLHREGLVDQRRHRPAAPFGHLLAAGAARRRDRRIRLVHLRPRLAGGVRGATGQGPRRG